MSLMNLTRVAAPVAAGLLIVAIGDWRLAGGGGGGYLVTTTLFLTTIVAEIHLPIHGMVAIRERKRFHKDLMEGFRYIRSQRTLMVLLSINIVFPLFAYPVNYILPVFSEEVFHNGATGLGILSAMVGVGGVIGALLATTLDTYRHKGRLMLVGGVWMGLFFIAFTQMDYFLPALFFLALGNIGTMVFHTTNNAVIQSSLPAEIRGRVMSVMMMSIGVMPLGTLPVGIAADHIGVQMAVVGSSTLLLLTLFAFFTLSRRSRHLVVEPLAHADLSPVQVVSLLAQGKITQGEADRRSGGQIAILGDGLSG